PAQVDLNHQPSSDVDGAIYWHAARQKLYAAAPASATVSWYNSGNTKIEIPIDCTWPANLSRYQIYVANSPPVSLSNGWSNASAKLLASDPSVGAEVEANRFRASGPGNSLLLLSQGPADAATNIYFQFVKSIV